MSTRIVDDYVKRLKRRRDYLSKTAEDGDHYAKAELAAVEWAIAYIEDTLIDAADHQSRYFDNKKGSNDENQIHNSSNNTDNTVR